MENKIIYEEILKVCNKYDIEELKEIKAKMNMCLYNIELEEKYGLKIPISKFTDTCKNYIRINDYLFIGIYGEKHRRTICNVDVQPIDEILLDISFPTGAYIFGDDYPKELFKSFFNELKSYNYKYCDEMNNSIYFTLENSKEIYNNFNEILNKYNKLNRDNYKQRQIENLEKEIERLKQ